MKSLYNSVITSMIGKKGGLMKRFKEGKNRRERLLFPPSIDEYLPDSHLARVVLEIVKQLDLREIEDILKCGELSSICGESEGIKGGD